MNGAPRAPRDRRYSTQAWRRVREQVRARDGRTCQACGRDEPIGGRKTFPVDHKNPTADFYDPSNLWLLCWSCNTSKSGMSVDEWVARSKRPVGKGFRGSPRPLARVSYPSPESGAARELGRIRAEVERWRESDMRTWPIVGGTPKHDHPRHSARCMVTMERVTWEVCPPGCDSPVRWLWPAATSSAA